MRYITNAAGYVVTVSFGGDVECDWGSCVEYTGAVPTGYTSLEAWYAEEVEKLRCWKVVNGNLTRIASAVTPKDKTIFELIYPAGAVYASVSPVSPAHLFGGTWEQMQDTSLPGVYMWKRIVLGGLNIEDDGAGNVIITTYGDAVIEDDGAGNVNIADTGSTSVTDDGAGNVIII